MPLAPNQRLFEYRIHRVLGQGAFGTDGIGKIRASIAPLLLTSANQTGY